MKQTGKETEITVDHLQAALQQIIVQCGAVLTALDSLGPRQRETLRFLVPSTPEIPAPDDVFCPKVVFCPKPIAVKQECWMPAPTDWAKRLEVKKKKKKKTNLAAKKQRKTK